MDISRLAGLALVVGLIAAAPAAAQVAPPATDIPRVVVEGAGGWTGFADDSVIHHTLLGVAARYYLTRRISVGPELQHMVGPGSDCDTLLTGNIVVDLLAPTADASPPHHALPGRGRRPVEAHVALHGQPVRCARSLSTEGAATLGVGLRGWVSRRVFVGADARIGWEPHLRLAGLVGVGF